MVNKQLLDIPLFVSDYVNDIPTKVSGRRRIFDLDELTSVPDDAQLIVQWNNKTYRISKNKFMSNLRLFDTSWDDLMFPASGQGLDTTTGRHGVNYYNGTIFFNSNARYTVNSVNEVVIFNCQMPHRWKEGTSISPHIHWLQQHATNIPNWLLGYIIKPKNTALTLETDFSNMTLLPINSHVFTYSSGVLEQISSCTDIDMTGYTLSDNIHFAFWRDSAGSSGEFGSPGTDPSALVEHVREFDIHFEIDSIGSNGEFTKDSG